MSTSINVRMGISSFDMITQDIIANLACLLILITSMLAMNNMFFVLKHLILLESWMKSNSVSK